MRILLLLSALLTAVAGSGASAHVAGVPTAQVGTLIDAVAARAAFSPAGRRPLVALPAPRKVRWLVEVMAVAPARRVPLYAGRLRT